VNGARRRVWRYLALSVVLILVAGATTLWTAPRWLVPHIANRFPGCTYEIETSAPAVALTIDDGPDAATTPDLLRELREHGAHATFFLISSHVAGTDSLVTAMVAEGHEIGNHLTRDEPSIALRPEEFDSALVEAGTALSQFGPVHWARPGGGRYSREMVATMERRGYRCALGSVYPYDATIPSSRMSSTFLLAHARPGAIIVLHDRGMRGRRTIAALHRVLPVLQRRGLRVVTVSELAALASGPARQ
jgi:peptidoglycan-N-acetylglucosamine deacetylase